MPDVITEYIEANDNASDYADSHIAGLEQDALEDIDDLFNSVENRDMELWDVMEDVDLNLTIEDYDNEEIRGLDWSLGMASISAASLSQFFLENRTETIIEPVAYRTQLLEGFNLTRAQLITAGKRGFEIAGTAAFETLSAEVLERFAFMNQLSNVELYEHLLKYDAIRPVEQTIASAQGYVSRMTNYKPGSTQFKEEVANLISRNSKRGLQGMNRRAVSQLHTIEQIGGDIKKLVVWIVEGGKNTCSFCASNAGDVHTYEEWASVYGLPGSDVCLGGDS